MRHLVFMRFNNSKVNRTQPTVHIQKDVELLTWCNQAIMSSETFEGRPISLVTETTKAATCIRCGKSLKTAIIESMKKLETFDIEKVYNFIHPHV